MSAAITPEVQADLDRITKAITKLHGATSLQLAGMLDIGKAVMNKRLAILRAAGIARPTNGVPGKVSAVWIIGRDPDIGRKKCSRAIEPYRPVVKDWRTVARRDPLVAALFGEAGAA